MFIKWCCGCLISRWIFIQNFDLILSQHCLMNIRREHKACINTALMRIFILIQITCPFPSLIYIPILWSGWVLSLFVIYDNSDTMCKMRINWKIENGTDMHGYLKEYFTGFSQLFFLSRVTSISIWLCMSWTTYIYTWERYVQTPTSPV